MSFNWNWCLYWSVILVYIQQINETVKLCWPHSLLAAVLRSSRDLFQLSRYWPRTRVYVHIFWNRLKEKYVNDFTNEKENFNWPSGFLIFPCGATWIIGAIVNHFQIKPEERTHIPNKNSAICAITVAISTLTYTYAIYLTNFPVVMMFKSCNLISVILVGVLCSRVKDKKLKLATKKIVVGIIITIGIIMFKVFDPASSKKNEKQT